MFGGQGMSWLKIRLQIRETAHKVREATQFFSRGLRLMGSDLGNCGRLFVKAGSGGLSCRPTDQGAPAACARKTSCCAGSAAGLSFSTWQCDAAGQDQPPADNYNLLWAA